MLNTDVLAKVLMHENLCTVPIGYQKLVLDAVEEVLTEEKNNGVSIFNDESETTE